MRVRDVTLHELNSIANEPDVLVMIDPEAHAIDLSWYFDVPGMYLKGCVGVNGAVAFLPHSPGRYELHYFMPCDANLPSIRAIIDWMFTNANAEAIFGATPRSNLAARLVNRWLGGVPVSTMIDGAGRPCIVYELTRETWASTLATAHKARRTALLDSSIPPSAR